MASKKKRPHNPPKSTQSSDTHGHDEYFSYFNDYNKFSFEKIPPREAVYAINAAERGDFTSISRIMAAMLKDPDILSPYLRRVSSINSLAWSVEPAVNPSQQDIYYAEQIDNIFRSVMNIPMILTDMCSAILYGFVGLEIACREDKTQPGWDYIMSDGKKLWYPKLVARPPNWFQTLPENGHKLMLRDSSFSTNGIELEPYNWVIHRHPLESNYYGNDGVLIKILMTYISKDYSQRDWDELLEKLGIPPIIGRYQASATPRDRDALRDAVTGIGHAQAGILPKGTEIEMLTAATATDTQFISKIEMDQLRIEKLILGTALNDAAKLGGVEGVRFLNKATHQRLIWDTHLLARTIENCIIGPMMGFSFGNWDQLRKPKFVFDTKVLSEFGAADGIHKLVSIGAEVPVYFINDAFNIPKAGPGQKILVVTSTSPQAIPSQQLKSEMAPLQHSDPATDVCAGQINNDEWLKDLVARFDHVEDFGDVEKVFTDWLDNVDIDNIQKQLAYSIFLKRLQGRLGDDEELI